jgi:hypothetical protein
MRTAAVPVCAFESQYRENLKNKRALRARGYPRK